MSDMIESPEHSPDGLNPSLEEAEVDEATASFAQIIASVSDEFDVLCAERHAMGAEKYGPGKFLTVDTIEEALHEIVDLANYARYTYIKLRLLQDSIAAALPPDSLESGFIKSSRFTSVKG